MYSQICQVYSNNSGVLHMEACNIQWAMAWFLYRKILTCEIDKADIYCTVKWSW